MKRFLLILAIFFSFTVCGQSLKGEGIIAVASQKKDTLYLSETDPISKYIELVWSSKITKQKKPVILFVSNERLWFEYVKQNWVVKK